MRRPGKLLDMSELTMQAHMELNGNREAVVEGCGGVLEYDDTVVRVRIPGQVVRFSFQPPTLSDLFREAVGR